ncbi:MAG: tRNA pseudouridine(55) synthase TruB [Clostridiales bacterium]|nr:tRNA pseudouridine(55) synthase TruB [Clostridiales bacterium]
MAINGVILLNKERNVSSNKLVNKVKYLLKADKAGHLGTLDVLGEGLLPITLGKGTRLFEYYLNKDKIYKTVFKFGQTTDTLDLEGEVTQSNDIVVTLDELTQVVQTFIGKQDQMPPIYSAKKINGQKAYDLARAGQRVELKPKEIEIYNISVLNQLEQNTFELEVHCSSGTYIRSLCRDIATKLSTYGVMLSITRTKCGDFKIKDSYSLTDIENGIFKIIELDTLFDYECIKLNKEDELKILNGVYLSASKLDINAVEGATFKLFGLQGFLGLGIINQGKLKFLLRLI